MGFLSAFNKKPASGHPQPVEKLSALIASYVQRLETQGGTIEERSLTLIARSPSAAVAKALTLQADGLKREQVTANLVFARLAPFEGLAQLATALKLTGKRNERRGFIRIIKTPALLHAHEQLVLGRSSCWTGDMLRRSEENRNGLDLWEEDAQGSVRLAQLAFSAIWSIAKPVPERVLAGGRRVSTDRAAVSPAIAAAGLACETNKIPKQGSGAPITRH